MLELILGHPGVALDRQSLAQLALPAPEPDQPAANRYLEECDCVTGLIHSYEINSESAILRSLFEGWVVNGCDML